MYSQGTIRSLTLTGSGTVSTKRVIPIDINSISSVLHHFSDNYIVKIRVNCYHHKDSLFYTEVAFHSDDRGVDTVNIALNYKYYMTLESLRADETTGLSVRIVLDYMDLYQLVYICGKAVKLFGQHQLWKTIEDDLRVGFAADDYTDEVRLKNGHIVVTPSIYNHRNGNQERGMQIDLYDVDHNYMGHTVTTFDQTLGNLEFFNRVNPTIMAQLLVNFMQTPTPGTNRRQFLPQPTQVPKEYTKGTGAGIAGRQIGNRRNDIDSL